MTFHTARIALLEARMSGEIASLIRRAGGPEPLCVPAVREEPINAGPEVAAFIDSLIAGSIQSVVFFTGVGVKQLLQKSEQLGRQSELLDALRQVSVICRGPKPSAELKRSGIPITASAGEPYTTTEMLEVMASLDLTGSTLGVIHYGEYNAAFSQEMRRRGVNLVELRLYEWLLPEDTNALQKLVQEIVEQHIDAIVFTSQVQVRHLFQMATQLHLSEQLVQALNTKTRVASIGPTCTAVLQNYGVTPHIVPEHPKMGYLVKALAASFQTD